MRRLFFLFITHLIFCSAQAQGWAWDSVVAERGWTLKMERAGSGHMYLYPKDPFVETGDPVFIRKLDPGGAVQWSANFAGACGIVKVLSLGDSGVVVAGNYKGTMTIGTVALPASTHMGMWMARYTNGGNLVAQFGVANTQLRDVATNGTDLVFVGNLFDSTSFLGLPVNRDQYNHLFIARTGFSGSLKALKVAEPTVSGTESYAFGCAVDQNNNVFVHAGSYGFTLFGKDSLGQDFPGTTDLLLKFDPALSLQNHTMLYLCQYGCRYYHELKVTSKGEPVLTESHDYTQSGNDIHWSVIWKFTPACVSSGSFALCWHVNACDAYKIESTDLDSCDNIYYTGYQRTYAYDPSVRSSLITGALSSNLVPLWQRADSSRSNGYRGISVL